MSYQAWLSSISTYSFISKKLFSSSYHNYILVGTHQSKFISNLIDLEDITKLNINHMKRNNSGFI